MEEASQAVQTTLARVEHALLRPVNFLIVPLFALANAGVDLRTGGGAALASSVMVNCRPPSPIRLITGRPGSPSLAPMAAGRP